MEMETGSGDQAVVEGQKERQQVVAQKTMKKVLVAIDESEESFYALNWALDKLFMNPHSGGASSTTPPPNQEEIGMVTVVHVQLPYQPFIYPAGPVVHATPAVMESMRKAQEEMASAVFSRALQICKEKMIKAETMILKGGPKEMICQAVEQMHPDLLVVGSRGLGQIKRAFLGSVSDYCVHHAHCPVLIVRPPKVSHK